MRWNLVWTKSRAMPKASLASASRTSRPAPPKIDLTGAVYRRGPHPDYRAFSKAGRDERRIPRHPRRELRVTASATSVAGSVRCGGRYRPRVPAGEYQRGQRLHRPAIDAESIWPVSAESAGQASGCRGRESCENARSKGYRKTSRPVRDAVRAARISNRSGPGWCPGPSRAPVPIQSLLDGWTRS